MRICVIRIFILLFVCALSSLFLCATLSAETSREKLLNNVSNLQAYQYGPLYLQYSIANHEEITKKNSIESLSHFTANDEQLKVKFDNEENDTTGSWVLQRKTGRPEQQDVIAQAEIAQQGVNLKNLSEEDIKKLLDGIDANGDGIVDSNDTLIAERVSHHEILENSDWYSQLLKNADADGNGKIDWSDLAWVAAQINYISLEHDQGKNVDDFTIWEIPISTRRQEGVVVEEPIFSYGRIGRLELEWLVSPTSVAFLRRFWETPNSSFFSEAKMMKIMEGTDRNGDGQLNYEDFGYACEIYLNIYDIMYVYTGYVRTEIDLNRDRLITVANEQAARLFPHDGDIAQGASSKSAPYKGYRPDNKSLSGSDNAMFGDANPLKNRLDEYSIDTLPSDAEHFSDEQLSFFGEKLITVFDVGDNVPANSERQEGAEGSLSHYAFSEILKMFTTESESLEEIAEKLASQETRTDSEDKMLAAIQAIQRDSDSIDADTLEELKNAVQVIEMMESMREVFQDVDFNEVTKILTNLVRDQNDLYSRFIAYTEKIYRQLETILGIEIGAEGDMLTSPYSTNSGLSPEVKRKIAVDRAVTRLTEKDRKMLSEGEKEALKIYDEKIVPLQKEYRKELSAALEKFLFDIRTILMDSKPASALKEKGRFKALFLLKNYQG